MNKQKLDGLAKMRFRVVLMDNFWMYGMQENIPDALAKLMGVFHELLELAKGVEDAKN